MKIIKYQGTDITAQFNAGRWSHPESGVKYPSNFPPEEIDGVTVELVPEPEPVEPSIADQLEALRGPIQAAVDNVAAAHGFSNGNALMLYAGFDNPFRALALTFATWEASVWMQAITYRDSVLAGDAPMITADQAVAMMPAFDVS